MARARVILTTYERPQLLKLSLAAWARQTFRDFAMTIADDGSGPETAEVVRSFAATAPFPVHHSWWEHRGFRRAGVLNQGVRSGASEPMLLFTDGDCVPPATLLAEHVAVHGPRSFAVGGAIMVDRESSATVTEATIAAGGHERLGGFASRFKNRRRRWKSILGVALRLRHRPKVLGANVSIDRALFDEVNGFDESFVGWGLEDSDLRDRLMAMRPRPVVRILLGRTDTIHLWHPPSPSAGKRMNRPYYDAGGRPIRCVHGLRDERPAAMRAAPGGPLLGVEHPA